MVNPDGIMIETSKVIAVMKWNLRMKSSKIRTCLAWSDIIWDSFRLFQDSDAFDKIFAKKVKFDLGQAQDNTFCEMIRILINTLVLTLQEGNKDLVVYSDTCYQGVGCILMQREKVIT